LFLFLVAFWDSTASLICILTHICLTGSNIHILDIKKRMSSVHQADVSESESDQSRLTARGSFHSFPQNPPYAAHSDSSASKSCASHSSTSSFSESDRSHSPPCGRIFAVPPTHHAETWARAFTYQAFGRSPRNHMIDHSGLQQRNNFLEKERYRLVRNHDLNLREIRRLKVAIFRSQPSKI
jgi:hypothetical protein